ncbi:MAG: DUF669 domain-containing protein [Paludibacteraceae bacterium]|nr:DUF669 domain-containing protein [Paludibacteraceae bacterium]
MAVDFAKFDKNVDLEGLKADVEEAAKNDGGTGNFKEVPHDKYEVAIEKLEMVLSKKGDPMLSCWMKILDGDYENSRIFMNQVVTQGFQFHITNEFLRSLVDGMNIDVHFESYAQYAELVMDIHEMIDGNREYLVNYGERKGFNTFKIEEVYDVE